MTTDQLQGILNHLGCVRIGGTTYAPCPLCQPNADDPADYHMTVGVGTKYPVMIFCTRCSISKPQTETDRELNRQLSRNIWGRLGVDVTPLYTPMEADDIRQLWGQVKVGGLAVEEDGKRASDHTLHLAYWTLLNELALSDRHRKWLVKRGLDPDRCWEVGYRTGRAGLPCLLQAAGIPGVIEGQWNLRPDALLIPCRDRAGLVGAIKQRLTDGRVRMRLLSGGGVKAKQMVHFPIGTRIVSGQALWCVEGERKADAIRMRTGVEVVGIPGVGSWSQLVPLCVETGWAVLALDADDAGRRYTGLLGRTLAEQGVNVQVAQWTEGKGPDDAICNGQELAVKEWEEVRLNYDGEPSFHNSPPTKTVPTCPIFVKGQMLKDYEILPYIRQFQPVLRRSMRCYQLRVEDLIRKGQVRMQLTQQGQLLEAGDDCQGV